MLEWVELQHEPLVARVLAQATKPIDPAHPFDSYPAFYACWLELSVRLLH